ncbi:MAG TPA: FlgO family outer membrane protein [Candidatus Acidoferrum sp.]|nr:FlgO family outer membrane protein [Candidatus Acidoferrum sp.]
MRARPFGLPNVRSIFIGICLLGGTGQLLARPSGIAQTGHPALPQEGIFLVFPFENVGASARLDWIGEGLEELTIQRLSEAGQQVYSHAGRLNEMDRYGLPSSAKLSRATMLHIGQEMDADYVVFGEYTSDGKTITVRARIMRVNPVALLPAIGEGDSLASLMGLHTKLTWKLLGSCDHGYPLNLAEFSRLQQPLGLAAFEQYIRGLLANDDETRLRDLKEAARLEPGWPEPAFAIGEVYFQKNDCSAALPWYAKVPTTNARKVEASFATGVCRLRLGQPDKAEEVFNVLEEDLHRNLVTGADLPEISNNLAIARARQNNLPPALTALGRARDIDPDEDDYPFNLGLLALQQKDLATAETHFREAVQREADNPEDLAFLIYTLDKLGKKPEASAEREAATEAFGEKGLPLLKFDSNAADSFTKYQRIKGQLDVTSLRLELEGPQTQQVAGTTDPSALTNSAVAHIRLGRQESRAGRLDAAEKEFQTALVAEPRNASAHRELADIYRRRGKLDEAAHELQLSLAERDSAAVRTTLARIYLEQKKYDLARSEVEKAIKLAPNYPEAKELLEHLEKSKPAGGAQ